MIREVRRGEEKGGRGGKKNIQMCANCLLSCEMVDIRSRDTEAASLLRTATWARAIVFNGSKVLGVSGVFEIQDATGSDGIAKALLTAKHVSCGQDNDVATKPREREDSLLFWSAKRSRTCPLRELRRRQYLPDNPVCISICHLVFGTEAIQSP